MTLSDLREYKTALEEQINTLIGQLAQINGDEYQGCWLDSAQNRKGTIYRRLRWFINVETKRKGCKTLKPNEVARAEKAIALWSELERLQRKLAETEERIGEIERQVRKLLGYEV